MRSARTLVVCIIFLSSLAMAQTGSIPTIEQPLAPTAAQPGGPAFTLKINGTGFNIQPAFVQWREGTAAATQLTITSSTATQLTVTVPAANIATAGTASVSVVGETSLTEESPFSNVAFFQIATPASPQFAPPVFYTADVDGTVESVLAADFNGDGILDLAMGVPNDPSQICILLGNSNGTFQTPTCYQVDNASSMVAGVFNDVGGFVDIAVGDNLLVGAGNGTFTVTALNPEGFIPYAVGDFSQTGVLDIAGTAGGNVQILNNDGRGNFSAGQNFTGSITQFGGMLTADFNGDGILDLAVLDIYAGGPAIRVYLGATGTAGFNTNPVSTNTQVGAVSFTAADFNGDGKQDLAIAFESDGSGVAPFLGNGDGTFTLGTSFTLNTTNGAIVTADFNEDGKLDLATGAAIVLGNGDGTFQTPIYFEGEGNNLPILATGDFNGDGRPDLVVQDGGGGSILVALQQAPATAPVVSLSPTSVNFGSQTVGTSASAQIVLTNTGNAVLAIDSIGIVGTNASEFSVLDSGCSASLAAGSNCAISIAFSPTTAGTATASLSITDNAAGSPQMVPLTGVGQSAGAPAVSLSPASLTFTALAVGTTSASQSVTLSNTGNAALNIGSISVSGTAYAEFSQTNNCGTSLAMAATCTINVTATPTAVGPVTASISITDNAANSPQTVALAGTGSPFALTTTCTSLTVVPGQTAIFTVDLAPAGGNSPSVALACSGAPALATCTVSPNSVALSAATTAQVTATTTQATGFLQSPFRRSDGNRMAGLVGLAGITGFAGLVMLPGKRRVKPGRRLYGLIFLLCLLATVATLPSCGGGGVDPPGTAAGTYPLTVTGTFQSATGGLITETVSFNLVVQQ